MKFKVGDIIVHISNPKWSFEVLEVLRDNYRLKTLTCAEYGTIGEEFVSSPNIDNQNRKITKLEKALR